MAANYWASTQKLYWQFSKTELQDMRQDLETGDTATAEQYPLPDRRLLSISFNQQLVKLGKRMSVRQQALATAQVYVRRFYIKVDVRDTNPYLILATALYLACKMEESPQYIRVVVNEARTIWPGKPNPPPYSLRSVVDYWKSSFLWMCPSLGNVNST